MTLRPVPVPVVAGAIPSVMREQRRWCNWRYELRHGRWTKIPYQPFGSAARVNDRTTFTAFEVVIAAMERRRFDGVGFLLGDGWSGVDVDHPLEDALRLLPHLASIRGYCETSPSGRGFKVFGRSTRGGGEIRFSESPPHEPIVTSWASNRFFTVTGHGAGNAADDLTDFLETYFPVPKLTSAPTTQCVGYEQADLFTDDELLLQMLGTDAVGDKIVALWEGDISGYGGDHSRADQALCCYLAFWTNYDAERVDRMFRQSGLMRQKWNVSSYRRATLARAFR